MTELIHLTPAQALRQNLRCTRREIPGTRRKLFDQAIRQHLLKLIDSSDVSSVAAFWPFDGEPDVIPLCGQLSGLGIEVALPKISASGNRMEFHSWQPRQPLEPNRFGIPEPSGGEKKTATDFSMLLVPLVGYDRDGNRLGMGSGYYDRYLQPLKNSLTAKIIGVAYSLQEADSIDPNDWDIPLHAVVNENGWFTFNHQSV